VALSVEGVTFLPLFIVKALPGKVQLCSACRVKLHLVHLACHAPIAQVVEEVVVCKGVVVEQTDVQHGVRGVDCVAEGIRKGLVTYGPIVEA